MDNDKVMNDQELGEVAGGGNYDYIHDLSLFVERIVCNVIRYDESACLTLRRNPNGTIIPGVGWQNGDHILVHSQYREDGWYFAFDRKTQKFGYVNPNNIM